MAAPAEKHGSHASVDIRVYKKFREKGNYYVLKQYRIDSQEEGLRKMRDLKLFCNVAAELGIETPHQGMFIAPGDFYMNAKDDRRVEEFQNQDLCLNLLQEFGGSMMTTSMQNGGNPEELIGTYLHQFKKVFDAGHPISLDPPLANFNNNGVLIDVFPPRHALDGEPLIEYALPSDIDPAELKFLTDRYYGPEQAITMYAQILRSFGDKPVPKNMPERIVGMIDHILGGEAAERVNSALSLDLDTAGPTDIDAIRAIACHLHATGDMPAQSLAELFKLTHIEANSGQLPPQSNIIRARDILYLGNSTG